MLYYSRSDLENLPTRFKSNLINSCTGYKSCNLLGTISEKGVTNLAIFNSIVHIGSNPPLLGFILRPLTVKRDTYENLMLNRDFTVNHVNKSIIKSAHQTSAKYEKEISEFEKTGLTAEYLDGFPAPYVGESMIKLGCRYENSYEIKENGCLLIIGSILHIYLPIETQHKDGWVQLDKAQSISAIGLDGYALPELLMRLAYARRDEFENTPNEP
ncbi:flavin reductase family protein [Ulvibacterium marinum]|uniref:flavin reductase family protein n=1 Tax=Ulvibacterium marinum TaxID=2419782 RepID=UPI0024947147|nr:flavin reductase [Ulvibacterium marinum]